MPANFRELYTDAELEKLRRKIKAWTVALAVISAVGLAVCVTLAVLTNTANAQRMELYAIAVSIAVGWFVIYCACFAVGSSRRELAHAGTLRDGERERTEGRVTVTRQRLRIKKSITAKRVRVETPDGESLFWVAESRAPLLEGASAVWTVHGYVAGYEVAK